MEPKWSDGNWSIEYDNAEFMGGGQWFKVVSDQPETLLWCPYSAPDSVLETCKANAELMAASRDMYESLDRISRRLQMDIDDGSRPDQWSMEALVRDAAKAMAKARGEKQ